MKAAFILIGFHLRQVRQVRARIHGEQSVKAAARGAEIRDAIGQRPPGEPYRVRAAFAGVEGFAFFTAGVGVVAAANSRQCDNLICPGIEIVRERKNGKRQRQSGDSAIYRSSPVGHGDGVTAGISRLDVGHREGGVSCSSEELAVQAPVVAQGQRRASAGTDAKSYIRTDADLLPDRLDENNGLGTNAKRSYEAEQYERKTDSLEETFEKQHRF